MPTVFQGCDGEYGGCVRQFIIFGLCLIVSALAGYSCFKIWRLQKGLSFQMWPLIINTVTSLALIYFYIQVQPYNTAIYLFIVEIYTYFIICYGMIGIVIDRQGSKNSSKLLNKILALITTIAFIALVALLIIENVTETIGCRGEQGIGTIVMIVLEIPLMIVTFKYSKKFKNILTKHALSHKSDFQHSPTFITKHLIEQEDRYVVLKKMQASLCNIALFVSFVLHIINIAIYYADGQNICNQKNHLQITNLTELIMRWIQNIAELFPHFVIPFIFWYLPDKIETKYSSVHISTTSPNLSKIGPKKERSKESHQQSQFYHNMHNEDAVRQKLIPKSIQKRSMSHS